jgi:hypothetical protein
MHQNWKAGFEWGQVTAWEDRLSELAGLSQIQGAQCSKSTKENKLASGSEHKGVNTGCTEGKNHMTLFRIQVESRFRMGSGHRLGRPFE